MKKVILSIGALALLAACTTTVEEEYVPATLPPAVEHDHDHDHDDHDHDHGDDHYEVVFTEGVPIDLPFASVSFTPGTHSVTVPSYQENPMTVEVDFSENQITRVEIMEHGDSAYGSGWFWRAIGVPDQILVHQSTNGLDTFVGATITQESVVTAVEEAITLAGANPADLVPQEIVVPLSGDRFIPGYHRINVPANTMDIYGEPLTDGALSMLYSETEDMYVSVTFARNEFHVHTGGGQNPRMPHGESSYNNEIQGGTWGGFFHRQVVPFQISDQQSTHVDIHTGATQSASAIVWAVEQAMIAAGANPATITPRTYPRTQVVPNPDQPDARFFVPGHYNVVVQGAQGPIDMTVTVDRGAIRRIVVNEQTETESFWDQVWPDIRNYIYETQSTNEIAEMDIFVGATLSTEAIIEGVREALQLAGENNPENW